MILRVHLPHEEHWFLLVISIITLCLYIYDCDSCHVHMYKLSLTQLKTNS